MALAHITNLGVELFRAGMDAYKGTVDLPPLIGMTLDRDDAEIAAKWLHQPEGWDPPETVSRFESAFAKWNGSQHAFAFSAGRRALSACIYALDLEPGDEVILPGYTCIVVQNAFDFAGVNTVHCDIELDTFGPDRESIAARITPRVKAILLHHLYGLVCRDYEGIIELARSRGLKIIEDCAHATGATFRGRRVGTLGDVGFYSSEWSKVFTTIVGGMAVTNNPALAEKFREYAAQSVRPDPAAVDQQLRTAIRAYLQAKPAANWWALPWARFIHGAEDTLSTPPSEIEGQRPADYFTRMPAPAAELGLNQLKKIDAYNEARRRGAQRWDKYCDEKGFRKPVILAESQPVFLRYPVLVDPKLKKNTQWAKRELKINLGVWFKTHLHPSPKPVKDCPNADQAVAQCVNFPCLP
jgi:dTDP-4-amino-4,6-dideoxygalactose transaminase